MIAQAESSYRVLMSQYQKYSDRSPSVGVENPYDWLTRKFEDLLNPVKKIQACLAFS